MKKMILGFVSLLVFPAFAGQDSVAVMFRAEKTVVLINETSAGRVHAWMDLLNTGSELHLANLDESVKVDCGRTAKTASCTFRFLPSPQVHFGAATVEAMMEMANDQHEDFEVSFESSRGDRFILVQSAGRLYLRATKERR